MSDDNRSPTIDYLRAISILWVLFYHFVPLKFFSKGTDGVLLFFMISGYCIALSAATSTSSWHFYAKRLGRLLPALIICSFLTTALKHAAPELIDAHRLLSWRDMFYSWLALPTLNVLHIDYLLPDGAYWSLDVEFHFYALIFIVMLVGLRNHILLSVCAYAAVEVYLLKVSQTNLVFYPFFIAGLAIAALNARHTLQACFGIAFAILLDLYFLRNGFTQPSAPVELSRSVLLWIAIAALIGAVKIHPPAAVAKILAPLAYVGLVSYPLYLIHQDVGLMFFNWIGVPYSDTLYPRLLRVFLAPTIFIAVAGFIHAFVERPLIAPFTSLLSGKRRPTASSASFPTPAQ
ncbi:MAG: acyltransferase [Bradyrhizobium sp.]|uniref:acyltransferase family protein n=1 Tax=Bradyrhizobium sp. TaxID=376 RepID=UPI001C28B922|nr:acyltransferase [Bradyrhizobium sp.]MBU6463939.1 acyltransferase [Pseudomonadota bacterium]MDE2067516.1 acyltransferase [Bradyrhizobium sp.]MDE2241098.1 acyltransferase [Bradyrhizobium sp.]MDE2471379.1 acyltransferase [Bradyrhizobium sp.]